jgi:hypothetical protein
MNKPTTKRQRIQIIDNKSVLRVGEILLRYLSAGKRPVVEILPVSRSTKQNNSIYMLYSQVAEQAEDQTILDITRFCKLQFGVPILRASSPRFRGVWDKSLGLTLTYEQKIISMDFLHVTSEFDRDEASQYIHTLLDYYNSNGFSIDPPVDRAYMRWCEENSHAT